MARKYNLQLDQGADFSIDLDLLDDSNNVFVLTSYNANASFRKYYGFANVWNLTCNIDANAGILTLSLTANQTANILAGRYVYDVKLTDTTSNTVMRLIEGILTVYPQVT